MASSSYRYSGNSNVAAGSYHEFTFEIINRVVSNKDTKRQYEIDRRVLGITLSIKDVKIPPPNETSEQNEQRLNGEYKDSLLRYMVATYEKQLPLVPSQREIDLYGGDLMFYLDRKYSGVVLTYVDRDKNPNRDPWITWKNVAEGIKQFNSDLFLINLSYATDENKFNHPDAYDIKRFFDRIGLPYIVHDLPVREQVRLKKAYPFAWLGGIRSQQLDDDDNFLATRDFPRGWILQNNQNIQNLADIMSSIGELNDILKTGNWFGASPHHIQQYEQLISILDNNPVTKNPLILFKTFDLGYDIKKGDLITIDGFASKRYVYNDVAPLYVTATHGSTMNIILPPTLIISYPAGHKFVMINEKLEFLTYPSEILHIDQIDGNDIYCHFMHYHPHTAPPSEELPINSPIINESALYAYEEIFIYAYDERNLDKQWEYNNIAMFLMSTDSITLPIKYGEIDSVKLELIDELNYFLRTRRFPTLTKLRQLNPELSHYINYFTKNVITVTPSEATDFYEKGYRTLEDLEKDEFFSKRVKDAIYWRAHLTQSIDQDDIDDVMVIINRIDIGAKYKPKPKWLQNYPVIPIMLKKSVDIILPQLELNGFIKSVLIKSKYSDEPTSIIFQRSPNKTAHVVELTRAI